MREPHGNTRITGLDWLSKRWSTNRLWELPRPGSCCWYSSEDVSRNVPISRSMTLRSDLSANEATLRRAERERKSGNNRKTKRDIKRSRTKRRNMLGKMRGQMESSNDAHCSQQVYARSRSIARLNVVSRNQCAATCPESWAFQRQLLAGLLCRTWTSSTRSAARHVNRACRLTPEANVIALMAFPD